MRCEDHPADLAEDAARMAVEGVGIGADPAARLEKAPQSHVEPRTQTSEGEGMHREAA